MEVLSDTAGLVTNFEGLQEIEGKLKARPKPKKVKGKGGKLEKPAKTPQTVIEDKSHAYLQQHAGYLTEESAARLLEGLEVYELTVRENLQLINLGPTNAIDIHLVRRAAAHASLLPCRCRWGR